MNMRQTWSQLTLTPLEDDLRDIVSYVLYDESKLWFLKQFIKEFNTKIPKDTLSETATLIINVSQHMKDIVNPSILDALFEIKDFKIDFWKLKNYEFIVRKGHPRIITDQNLSRYMDIQKLYDYFKIMNTGALIVLVKTFEASLYEWFLQDIHKMQLAPAAYEYLKIRNDIHKINYKDLLKKLERTQQSMSMDMMYFGDEIPDEPMEDFTWFAYSDRSSEDYKMRLKIFQHLYIEWDNEFIQYLKEHQLFDFLYVRVLSNLGKISP
jgi:hypothetical protein